MFHSLSGRIREDENKAFVIMVRWGAPAGVAVVLLLLVVLYIWIR
jgi:hypothetical protein